MTLDIAAARELLDYALNFRESGSRFVLSAKKDIDALIAALQAVVEPWRGMETLTPNDLPCLGAQYTPTSWDYRVTQLDKVLDARHFENRKKYISAWMPRPAPPKEPREDAKA